MLERERARPRPFGCELLPEEGAPLRLVVVVPRPSLLLQKKGGYGLGFEVVCCFLFVACGLGKSHGWLWLLHHDSWKFLVMLAGLRLR